MKVGGIGGGGKKVTGASKTPKKETHKKVEAADPSASLLSLGADSAPGADQVAVSDHTQTLDKIREMVGKTEELRMSEVDRIVNDLKSGKFKIDFEKVAEGFIREAIMDEMSRRSRVRRNS